MGADHNRDSSVTCERGRARAAGVRLQSNAASSAACVGILAAYAGWRTGLLRAAGRRLSAPLARARGLLAQLAGSALHVVLHARAKSVGCGTAAATAADSGAGCRGCAPGIGHTVCKVPLPPRRPGGALCAPGGASGAETAAAAAVSAALAAGEGGVSAGLASAAAATLTAAAAAGCQTDTKGFLPDLAEAATEIPEIEVHVLDLQRLPAAALTAALSQLACDPGAGVLGLDAEWEPELKPGAKHRISVIQIATATRCWILQPGQGAAPQPPPHSAPHAGAAAPDTTTAGTWRAAPPAPPPTAAEHAAAPDAHCGSGLPEMPAAVAALLSDPGVIKAGVGIQEDVRRLERDFGVRVRGAVDVRLVAQAVAPACLAGGGSLRSLTEALLGRLLDKSAQRSHWGAGRLDEGQIAYAAHDAWLSRELLLQLHRMHAGRPPPPPPLAVAPAPTASPVPIQDFAAPFLDVFSGLKAKRVEQALGSAAGRSGAPAPAQSRVAGTPMVALGGAAAAGGDGVAWRGAAAARLTGPAGTGLMLDSGGRRGEEAESLSRSSSDAAASGGAGGGGAGSQRLKEHKLPTRKSVLYENCRLLAPDGAVLCTCGAKKVRWYLERGLADVVSENPTTIQLRFEPRGRGHADDAYYLSDKENRCCVCGSDGEYLRHSVVPHCYRQHFPPSMKSHLSHDIVLMCPPCHKASSVADQRRMAQLGQQFGAPLGSATAAKFRHDSSLGAVRSAGRALSNPKVVIPPERRCELEAVVRAHLGLPDGQPLEAGHIAEAANVDPRSEDVNWCSHAELVVRALGGREALEGFIRGWRRHFLDTMRPRFLPPHWRVDARVANSAAPEGEEGEGEGQEEAKDEDGGEEEEESDEEEQAEEQAEEGGVS